tara:strand:- start:193 stop:753 length:561 start_codon:yes stop_codon:yes gene_type:complete
MDKISNKLKKYKNDEFNPKLFKYNDFLSLKFSLSKKLNINCFKNDDFDVIKIKKNKIFFDKNIILTNIKKCKLLPLYIYDINNDHLISLVIDNNKKLISLFNTSLQENNTYYKKIINLFNLDYKFILNNDNIKCDSYKNLCVPLSLLMIYSYFNKINMNNFLKYINKISVESSYNLIDNFINYLEN